MKVAQWISEILPFFETQSKDILWWDKDFLLRHDELYNAINDKGFQIISVQNALDARLWFELHLKKEEQRYLLVSQHAIELLPDMKSNLAYRQTAWHDVIKYFDTSVCNTMNSELLDELISLDKKQFEQFTRIETEKKLSLHHFEQWFERNDNYKQHFYILLERVKGFRTTSSIPFTNTAYWEQLIPDLSKMKQLSLVLGKSEITTMVHELEKEINLDFQVFIEETHSGLASRQGINQPFSVCNILDHIHFRNETKIALLIIDGLNWWQWEMLKSALEKHEMPMKEYCTYAWLPSITAWSRQAIFKGSVPNLNENNSKEAKLFEEYWKNKNIPLQEIGYTKFDYKSALKYPNVSHLAIVINDIDEMLHGSIMGNIHLHRAIEKWMEKGNIIALIQKLKADGYTIYLSADHGNVEAQGIGNLTLQEKVGNESRSKRHIHFPNPILAKNFIKKYPIEKIGEIRNSVYLRHDDAFTLSEQTVVTHGGSHFWEIIVPFIVL